jgi:hypothetical protein
VLGTSYGNDEVLSLSLSLSLQPCWFAMYGCCRWCSVLCFLVSHYDLLVFLLGSGDSDFSAAQDEHQQGLQDPILFLLKGCFDSIQTLVWETIQVRVMIPMKPMIFLFIKIIRESSDWTTSFDSLA